MFCKTEEPFTLFPHCLSLSILPFDFNYSLLLSDSMKEPGIQVSARWPLQDISLAFWIGLHFLLQCLFSWIHWLVVQWAEWAWTWQQRFRSGIVAGATSLRISGGKHTSGMAPVKCSVHHWHACWRSSSSQCSAKSGIIWVGTRQLPSSVALLPSSKCWSTVWGKAEFRHFLALNHIGLYIWILWKDSGWRCMTGFVLF